MDIEDQMIENIILEIEKLKDKIKSFTSAVKEDELLNEIKSIEEQSLKNPDFWSQKESKHLLMKQSGYKKFLDEWNNLKKTMDDADVLLDLYNEGETSVEKDLQEIYS